MNRQTHLPPRLSIAVLLICMASAGLASHPKPPHGHWTGKVVNVTKSSITLSLIDSWPEWGTLRKGEVETFRPAKPAFTIDEKAVDKQDLSLHFKIGDIVTLMWQEEKNGKNHIFWDIGITPANEINPL